MANEHSNKPTAAAPAPTLEGWVRVAPKGRAVKAMARRRFRSLTERRVGVKVAASQTSGTD
eukprot:6880099-Lingulodinium_polyedra.AAC.1